MKRQWGSRRDTRTSGFNSVFMNCEHYLKIWGNSRLNTAQKTESRIDLPHFACPFNVKVKREQGAAM